MVRDTDQFQLNLNEGLEEAQQLFEEFEQLGAVLAARSDLDAQSWIADLDQIESSRLMDERRHAWREALTEMINELKQSEEERKVSVLHDHGVQQCFKRLLKMIEANHPTLNTLEYRGDQILVGKQEVSGTLSEGQTVLVNIAAAIAVASKMVNIANQPGWIIFDEPTNGLDQFGCAQVADYLGGLSVDNFKGQVIVASFDEEFVNRLIERAKASCRNVKHVRLPAYRPKVTCIPSVHTYSVRT